MKRLNKKGFTLVELLAVIIILAVVVGITIPAVLTAVSGAKENQFKSAAEIAAKWFDDQYQLYSMTDLSMANPDTAFTTFCPNGSCTNADGMSAAIVAAGLKVENIDTMTVTYTNGKSCVVLKSKANGDYVTNAFPVGSTSTAGSGCAISDLGLKAPAA